MTQQKNDFLPCLSAQLRYFFLYQTLKPRATETRILIFLVWRSWLVERLFFPVRRIQQGGSDERANGQSGLGLLDFEARRIL